MKKFLVILVAICMMASLLCITAFAAGGSMRIGGQKMDGTVEAIKSGTNFEEIWEAAIDYALDEDYMDEHGYGRIVVTLYGDWNANEKGKFGDSWSDGFQQSTIYIPEGVRITLDMNGNTIDRGLQEEELSGEVIYIDEDADVLIKNGTISGGFSKNGAGGIHIHDAYVVLEKVNVVGSKTKEHNGAGIALYGDATLIMNGGSIANNIVNGSTESCGGALYAEGSVATLNKVTIRGNEAYQGAAVAARRGCVITLNDCTVENNNANSNGYIFYSMAIGRDDFIFNNTVIRNNGNGQDAVFLNDDNVLTMNGCTVSGNKVDSIFCDDPDGSAKYYINNTRFVDNDAMIANYKRYQDVTGGSREYNFGNCTFNNNNISGKNTAVFYGDPKISMTMVNCDLGDTSFSGKEHIEILNDTESLAAGSMFGEGSPTMIVALLALVVSCVAVFLIVDMKKKVLAAVNNEASEENDDDGE